MGIIAVGNAVYIAIERLPLDIVDLDAIDDYNVEYYSIHVMQQLIYEL